MKINFFCGLSSLALLFCNLAQAHDGPGREYVHYHDQEEDDDHDDQDNSPIESSSKVKEADGNKGYDEIHTKELHELLDKNKNVIVVDSRPADPYDNKIPGSKSVPYNAKDEIIEGILTNKEALIVVYCYSPECHLSTKLAKRLVKLGYKNVVKFPEGIKGWQDSEKSSKPLEPASGAGADKLEKK